MIDLEDVREYMRRQSEEDRKNRTVQVEAASIDEGLRQASIELAMPVAALAYEVLARGTPGTFGMGRRPWRLSVYVPGREARAPHEEAAEAAAAPGEAAPVDSPGEVFVRIAGDGAFLRVTKPRGRGARATEVMALERLALRGVSGFDTSLVARVVRHADGEWVRVADVRYVPANDSVVSVEIGDGDMRATIVASEPGAGGADPTAEYLRGRCSRTASCTGSRTTCSSSSSARRATTGRSWPRRGRGRTTGPTPGSPTSSSATARRSP